MENPLEVGRDRYPVEPDYVYARDAQLRFDQKKLASLVGFAAFGLPLALGIGALIHGPLEPSISHFYYRSIVLGDLFVGTLVFIGSLLFAYRGWNRKVGNLASIAGVLAFAVALFPTDGWAGPEGFVEGEVIGIIHLASAAGLFLTLAFFCFFVFTRVDSGNQTDDRGELTAAKRARNRVYLASGAIIVGALVVIPLGSSLLGARWTALRLTFWFEALALCAFGASWITVGRFMGRALLDRRDVRDLTVVERREQAGHAAKSP